MTHTQYPSISLTQTRVAINKLDQRLARAGKNWLAKSALVFLDRPGNMVYAQRGDLAPSASLQDAHDRARTALLTPDQPGAGAVLIRRGDGMQLGAIGVFGPDSPSSHLMACILCEFIFDPSLPEEFLAPLIEEHFTRQGFEPPEMPHARIFGASSQAGLAAVIAGAAHQDLLPGGVWGWPSPLESELPQPHPGTRLIDTDDIPRGSAQLGIVRKESRPEYAYPDPPRTED